MRIPEKVYGWVLFLPALLPLFYVEGMMYPLMTPKTLALRAFGIIALALFTYLALAGKSFYWGRMRRWETWIPGALLAVAYLASLLGADFYHSFWSTFERGDGLLTLSVCVGYFYLVLLSADTSWLKRLFQTVAWVGSLAALYLVLQWLVSLEVVNLPFIVKPNGRVGGTMGNAAFLASYLGMALFMTVAAAREHVGRIRLLLYAGAALELLAIFLAATRGTLLALFSVGILWLLYYAGKGMEKSRTYSRIALLTLVIITGLFVAFRADLAEAPVESVRRLASISLADSTVSSRLFIWRTTSSEAIRKPILGYGAEHADILFDRVYDPTAIVEEWFDRTHNAYLDYFVQFGILGVLFYLTLIATLAGVGLRLWRAGNQFAPYILSITAVYAIQNFFVFDTGVTLWLLLVFLSMSHVLAAADSTEPLALGGKERPFAGAFLGFAIFLLIVPVVVQPLRANLLAFETYLYQVVDVPRANAATKKGLALGTYADLEFGYNAYFMYTEEQVNRLAEEDLRLAYESATKVLTANFNRYPYDARTALYLAQVFASAPTGTKPDNGLLSEVLAHAIQESPKRVQSWYILANLSISGANIYPVGSVARKEGYRAAEDILRRYTALVPDLAEPYFILAQLEYASGDLAAASRDAAKGKAHYKSSLKVARRAASYYESIFDLPSAAFFLREILQFDPNDTNAREDLSQIEAREGVLP